MNASLKKIVFLHSSSNRLDRDHFDSCNILRQVRVSRIAAISQVGLKFEQNDNQIDLHEISRSVPYTERT